MFTSRRAKSDGRKQELVQLTEAQWQIMKVVWEEEPCATGTVQEALVDTKGWAYSTVKVTMDWMVKKGLLRVQRVYNLQLFHSRIGFSPDLLDLRLTMMESFGA